MVVSVFLTLHQIICANSSHPATVSQKITTFFWISTSNFVFPVLFGIVQISIYMSKPNDYLLAVYVNVVNVYVNIMGVVFATVWAAEARWAAVHHIGYTPPVISSIRFNSSPVNEEKKTRSIALTSSPQTSTSHSVIAVSESMVFRSSTEDRIEECGNEEKQLASQL